MTDGQALVAHFVDECRVQGKPYMIKALKGPIAQRIGVLLRDGCTPDEVKAGLTEFVRRSASNALRLHDIIAEQLAAKQAGPASDDNSHIEDRYFSGSISDEERKQLAEQARLWGKS